MSDTGDKTRTSPRLVAPPPRAPVGEKADGEILVGVISDTHGLLRSQALDALRDVDLIIHAGDVGDPAIIAALHRLAPTFAVRGNVDTDPWALQLPPTAQVDVGTRIFYVLHDIAQLGRDPAAAGFAAVVYGHSHKPSIEMRRSVLFLNPGSAGPKRFNLPVCVARVRVIGPAMRPEILTLDV